MPTVRANGVSFYYEMHGPEGACGGRRGPLPHHGAPEFLPAIHGLPWDAPEGSAGAVRETRSSRRGAPLRVFPGGGLHRLSGRDPGAVLHPRWGAGHPEGPRVCGNPAPRDPWQLAARPSRRGPRQVQGAGAGVQYGRPRLPGQAGRLMGNRLALLAVLAALEAAPRTPPSSSGAALCP
jgi:hypothetical protein